MKKILVLGFFDSLHKGHRFLFEQAKRFAGDEKEIYITTFDDGFLHAVGRNDDEIYLLAERKEILQKIGRFNIIVFPSQSEFILKTKEQFCSFLLKLDPTHIIMGSDYRFGKNAEGDTEFLRDFFNNKGVNVVICNFLTDHGEKISTRTIKKLLLGGDIVKANELLVDPFFYEGNVVKGRQDGRKMGIPTLNISIPFGKIKIKSGVYVTRTQIGDKKFLSVTNVGSHPTFGDFSFNVETHLIVNEEITIQYDEKIRVYFYQFIREIVNFRTKDDLIKQIENDKKFAKEVLHD